MINDSNNIEFQDLYKKLFSNKLILFIVSFISVLIIIMPLKFLNEEYRINKIKFNYSNFQNNIDFRKIESFYADLDSGNKISNILANLGQNLNSADFSIRSRDLFQDIVLKFTKNYIKKKIYTKNLAEIKYPVTLVSDRDFSSTLAIKTMNVDFGKYSDIIAESFNYDLGNHIDNKITLMLSIMDYQFLNNINDLKKANEYLTEQIDLKEKNKLINKEKYSYQSRKKFLI